MAIVKRRIMSRSRMLSVMYDDIDRKNEPADYPTMKSISADMAAYLLADGDTVTIYHDVQMDGTVVQYDDGK